MKILAEINFENVSEDEASTFVIRNTVRAVIFDNNNNIALMNVSKDHFHKVPGGGIDDNETPNAALERECREEAGVEIDSVMELGSITEIKKESKMVQNSYCYIARAISKKGILQLTDSEKIQGFEVLWVGIEDAINLVENEGYKKIAGRYIAERELTILRAAKDKYLSYI